MNLTKEQYLEGLVRDFQNFARGAAAMSISDAALATSICERELNDMIKVGQLRAQGGGRGKKFRITCRALAEFMILREDRSMLENSPG